MPLPKPSAHTLWYNYPTERSPCDAGYTNQCAIRLSIALEGASVPLNHFFGNKCVHGHARGAQDLANFLRRGWGSPTWTYRRNRGLAKQLLQSHQGVIFFQNCFTREGESLRRGDHIDVWFAGTALTYENFNGSDEIWFWKLQ